MAWKIPLLTWIIWLALIIGRTSAKVRAKANWGSKNPNTLHRYLKGKSGKTRGKIKTKGSGKGKGYEKDAYGRYSVDKEIRQTGGKDKGKKKKKHEDKQGKWKEAMYIPPQESELPDFCANFVFEDYRYSKTICEPNAFQVAERKPEISIFVELVEMANLHDIFLCPGPFTVLAPSNAAFQSNDSLLEVLRDDTSQAHLQELLAYHILQGRFTSEDFKEGQVTTLQGDTVDVSFHPIMFNQAGVENANIKACNGIIHIIDDVLIPSAFMLPDSPPIEVIAPTTHPGSHPSEELTVPPTLNPSQEATSCPPTLETTSTPFPTSATPFPTLGDTSTGALLSTKLSPFYRPTVPEISEPTAPAFSGPTAPAFSGPTVPAQTSTFRVKVTDYFIAYNSMMADREPTEQEYDQLNKYTSIFFSDVYERRFVNVPDVTFVELEMTINHHLYDHGYPEPRFNILAYFECNAVFADDSNLGQLNRNSLLDLMGSADFGTYTLDYVRQISDSPFASVVEVIFQAAQLDGGILHGTAQYNNNQGANTGRGVDGDGGNGFSSKAFLGVTTVGAVLMLAGIVLWSTRRVLAKNSIIVNDDPIKQQLDPLCR